MLPVGCLRKECPEQVAKSSCRRAEGTDSCAECVSRYSNEDNVDYTDPKEYGIVPIRGGSRARAATLARSSPTAGDGDGDNTAARVGSCAVASAAHGGARPGSTGSRGGPSGGGRGGRGHNGAGRAAGRGGRIGRGLSEAAAALLDMGFVEDSAEAVRWSQSRMSISRAAFSIQPCRDVQASMRLWQCWCGQQNHITSDRASERKHDRVFTSIYLVCIAAVRSVDLRCVPMNLSLTTRCCGLQRSSCKQVSCRPPLRQAAHFRQERLGRGKWFGLR